MHHVSKQPIQHQPHHEVDSLQISALMPLYYSSWRLSTKLLDLSLNINKIKP